MEGRITRRGVRGRFAMACIMLLSLVACGDSDDDDGIAGAGSRQAASCANMTGEAFVVRNDLVTGQPAEDARLLLRFVHFTDDHIIDDDGQAVNGASFLDPLIIQFEAAMRLQEEYADEVLNDMIAGVNTCHERYPAEFAIVTGDSADLSTIAETRRFIDNMDGIYDQVSAFETACIASLAEDAPQEQIALNCTRFTGRGVADTQSPDPDPDSPAFQLVLSRMLQQLLYTEQAALTGRAADGSTDPSRETVTRSPGLPEVLRCRSGSDGCVNAALAMPWYVAFGNHDGTLRGVIAADAGVNEAMFASGRHYMTRQHEFIDEFFFTERVPGPLGHGFNFAEFERREDQNPRNDGYYAFDAGNGQLRMIVLNTLLDGSDPRLPTDMLRNPFGLSDGSVDAEQFAWLQAELAEAAANDQLVMVFSHHADLTFAEFGMFAPFIPPQDVGAAELDAELASWPNVIAWVAGHTHLHRLRAFRVENGVGSNGVIEAAVECKGPSPCHGFWQIETASLIDYPQEQRLIEVFDNGDGTGSIRTPVLTHGFEKSRPLAEADDRCMFYLGDPEAVAAAVSEANLDVLCSQGGTRQGGPGDRNAELMFAMP